MRLSWVAELRRRVRGASLFLTRMFSALIRDTMASWDVEEETGQEFYVLWILVSHVIVFLITCPVS